MIEFRWNEWNLDHATAHGVSPSEAEHVVFNASRPYPRKHDGGKWIVKRQGVSMPMKKSKTAKRPGNIDRFLALSDREKEKVYRSVDREIPLDETAPMSGAERSRWTRATGKKGKPAVTSKVSVSIDQTLLAEVDRYADEHGLRRTELVSAGLRLLMANHVGAETE